MAAATAIATRYEGTRGASRFSTTAIAIVMAPMANVHQCVWSRLRSTAPSSV
jgi:hypothetical protein